MISIIKHITRRDLRLVSGVVMLIYIAVHLANHALGLISLDAAEAGLRGAVIIWHSVPGTILLYGAAATHIALAIWTIYERRTFRLPAAELLRIALGLWLPVMLIGHAITARLEFELVGSPSTYARIVSNLWASNGEWQHMGLLAPGWMHGCLGLHFILGRRLLWRRFQYMLFGAALLLPVLSALGFLEMGRELAREGRIPGPSFVANATSPSSATEVRREAEITMSRWRNGLLWGYLGIIGFAFGARAARNQFERRSRGRVTISYPDRLVSVPRGWSVLEASRAFHIGHASICGGRARCSTCRIRITAGADACPPPNTDERATLERIKAEPEVRLACQLRPDNDISVVPLVRADRPIYRQKLPAVDADRDVVLLLCDFSNRAALESDHLAHDVLFVFTHYAEGACSAIRAAGGTISYVAHDSICALFGLTDGLARASRQALAATVGIDRALRELNARLDQRWGCRANIVVSMHAGHAAMSHVGHGIETIVAAGKVLEITQELREAAARTGKSFAISSAVFNAARAEPPTEGTVVIDHLRKEPALSAYLTDRAPRDLADKAHRKQRWREKLDHASDLIMTLIQS
jgi:adenylate cyclase